MTAPFVLPRPSPALMATGEPQSRPTGSPLSRSSVKARPLPLADLLVARADGIIAAAKSHGQNWRLVGVSTLDPGVRGFCGPKSDWVLVPAGLDPVLRERGNLPMPESARKALSVAGKVYDFPVMYVAHEVPKGKLRRSGSFDGRSFAGQPDAVGATLLSSVPQEIRATAGARRQAGLANTASRVAMLTAGAAALTVAAAPFLLAAVLASGLGTDPVLIGAVPINERRAAGLPAAYIEIARWDY
jgi:hypothetical protein